MSPVCNTKAGRCGSALSRPTASCKVAVTSLFASLLKPMWLSLIWAKKMLFRSASERKRSRLRANDLGTPSESPRTAAVPAHAMQRRKPRRSMPSSVEPSVM